MMIGFDLLTVLVLLGLAQALGRPPVSVVVYAWSPVCINGFADRGQVDAAMTFFLALSVLLVLRRRPAWAGAAFAASTLVKISPLLLLLPLLRAGGLPLGLAFGATCALGLLPFAGAGVGGLRGLAAFAKGWRWDDSVYSVVLWLSGPLAGLVDPNALARGFVAVAALSYGTATAACKPRRKWEAGGGAKGRHSPVV